MITVEENVKKQYRAVVLNSKNGSERVESIWFDTKEDAIKAGEVGVPFYGGTDYTVESSED